MIGECLTKKCCFSAFKFVEYIMCSFQGRPFFYLGVKRAGIKKSM